MLAQSLPDLLIPPTSVSPTSKRETSPSSSLGRLCLFTPGPTVADHPAVTVIEGPLLTTQPIPDGRSRSGIVSTSTSPSVPSFVVPYQGVGDISTPAQQYQNDTFTPTPTISKGLRRPKSSNGLGTGLGRFHPFLPVRPRGSSTPGSAGAGSADLLIATSTSRQGTELSLDTVGLSSLSDDRPTLPAPGQIFSLHSLGPLDCPSASGTGVSSEEESICSPPDDVPSGLPLTIIGGPDAGLTGMEGRDVWGGQLPICRTWGRSLSGSSSGSTGSDGGETGTGKRKNARGLRIDVRRTFSVGGNVREDKKKEEKYVEPVLSKGIKYATVGRRPMLSISLDPLSPVKPRQATTSRSLFPLPRSNHLDLEGHVRPPYVDGPVEVVSGVWIGNEESVTRFDKWVEGAGRGMIVNVAKELDDPFGARSLDGCRETGPVIREYKATADRPDLTYLKLDWTHGETDLASESNREQMDGRAERWGFERTIKAMEEARRAGTPILIHCQCGISRSATLVIAYVLWLAHRGHAQEEGLGRESTMWEVNDHVKGKSEWVGPNVSLICQLLEWEKVLRQSASPATGDPKTIDQPDTTFAKREAEELDEQMKARSSKRRKSEPDCGTVQRG